MAVVAFRDRDNGDEFVVFEVELAFELSHFEDFVAWRRVALEDDEDVDVGVGGGLLAGVGAEEDEMGELGTVEAFEPLVEFLEEGAKMGRAWRWF